MTIHDLRANHAVEEGAYVREQLEQHGWSLSATAEALGVVQSTLQSLIKRHGLSEEYAEKSPKPGPRKRQVGGGEGATG